MKYLTLWGSVTIFISLLDHIVTHLNFKLTNEWKFTRNLIITVFWDVTQCSLVGRTTASNFTRPSPADGDNRFLRTLVYVYWTSCGHIPKNIHFHIRVNFRSYTKNFFGTGIAYSIVTGYGVDDRGIGVRVPVGSRIFPMSSRLGLGVHPASYLMGIRDSFPEGKATGPWSLPLISN
jgi:hypothetical protein